MQNQPEQTVPEPTITPNINPTDQPTTIPSTPSIPKPTEPESKNLKLALACFFLLILVATVALAFFLTRPKTQNSDLTTNSQTKSTPNITTALADCQSDLNCFITHAQNCENAKVNHSITIDLFGLKNTTTSYFELRGMEQDKCVFYIQTKKIDLLFPPNTPQDSINQQREAYTKLEGKDGSCKIDKTELVALLNNWKTGNLSTEDFKGKNCQGTYFSTSI